jgi:hypothetical protein
MKTDIRKFVDEIIEGLRLLIYQYIEIVWRIIRHPLEEPLSVARKYNSEKEKWPSPYVILFLTIALLWLSHFSLSSIRLKHPEDLAYFILTGKPPEGWFELLVIFIATFLILDIVVYFILGKLFFEKSRQIIHSAAIYLYASILLIFEIARNVLFVIVSPSIDLFGYQLDLVRIASIVFLFVLGIPLGNLLIKGISEEKRWPRQIYEKGIFKVISILFVGLITVYIIFNGGMFLREIGTWPLHAPTLWLADPKCVIEDERLTAFIIAENRGATYELLSENFFTLYLSHLNTRNTFINRDKSATIRTKIIGSSIGKVGDAYVIPPSKDGIFLVEADSTGFSRYKDWLLQHDINLNSTFCTHVLTPESRGGPPLE